ncbi:MAG TPA: vWA domain-containing protein, partial [Phycisphaeraceae bacterium]
MTAPAGAGRTKMDLANLGAASVLDLLSPMDEFGVVAVDSQAHVIADLEAVPQNKGPLRSRILRVESMGGGIFVYEALSTAARMLANARASTRHIILFSDAADSEEPGRYKELLEQCAQANITVSVIGLGTPQDVDAPLLEDIAKRGNGRIFFTADANELPQLFAQDTFVVARSAFIDEPTPVHATSGLTTLTGRSLGQPPLAGGYNLCYLREGANLAAVTQDEYAAPFIAAWQAGVGRAVAYTGEADGQFTGPIAQWEHMGELLTSLTRWVAGERTQLPEHMMLTQQVEGGVYTIRLHLDPEQPEATLSQLPRVTLLRGRPDQTPRQEQATLQWDATHSLALELPLSSDETVLASVDIPGYGRLTLTPVCLPYSPEFKPESVTRADRTLERLARISGGQERVDLGAIWSALPRRPQAVPIAHWLLLLAAGLVLLEVLERRTGALSLLPALGRLRRSVAAAPEAGDESPATLPASSTRRRRIQPPTPAQPTPPAATTTPPRPAPSAAAQPESPQQSVLDALRQARTRADQRTRRSQ